ncbi:hypothetical protein E1B28_000075 [Marasmius oreades]|uniref:Uncharacterized protein n=1 Tax=Marasmius oreades TaxID=181124 RepID=A0A9P7V0P1_9AGAR|nr:uncharacterized protein E1B28_000075 [Marasmius oreades]KAG7098101.1 hypothetical protein E1B28_000075 [Marasmius oreades]
MRFTPLSCSVLMVVGAVFASPIAVAQEPSVPALPHLRFGHAVGRSQNQNEGVRVISISTTTTNTGGIPCAGARSRFRQKSLELSNAFRQALGMPLIEVNKAFELKPIPQSHPYIERQPDRGGWRVVGGHPHPHHHSGHVRVHGHRGPFMMRLHYALMSLGAWEGRAVAFVLGCGIGVLIRMIWVLAVVAYRAVKGNSEEEDTDGYLRLTEETADAEEIFVAPPQYVVDEKPPVDDKN